MNTYVLLLRGINVGGKNKIPMAELKKCLEEIGYSNVLTYIASGNVLLDTSESAVAVTKKVQEMLVKKFKLDSELIKVLVLTQKELEKIVHRAPRGFGKHPEMYHSDVLFLIEGKAKDAMKLIELQPDVDAAWEGEGVLYFQRLSAQRTKSKLSRIISKPFYKDITIRNWNTTVKLLQLLEK